MARDRIPCLHTSRKTGKKGPRAAMSLLALALLVALLSLGGIPPFAGFFGKLLVFGSAVQAGQYWLAVIGIINSAIGLYYYLVVLKVAYLYRSEGESKPVTAMTGWKLALVVSVAAILVLGVVFAPWYTLSTQAAGGFWALGL